ncbi:inositol monophosphatase family protein [Amycolatopsis sp. NPDC049252]|uniref:inositol monophosphatase family protein n=1 Tax=Amycolatopsis sp. NPDC049252 TaxID=3363933 RepID=UPI00371BA2F5
MSTTTPFPQATTEDTAVLTAAVAAVRDAGRRLLAGYSPASRPADRAGLLAAIEENERTSIDGLRAALTAARPEANWPTEEQETAELPPGEWWAVDAVEGNVNHVHGLPEWCVTATLLRDGVPVLTAVHQPVGNVVHTAIRGHGAFADGRRLRVSAKTDLGAAIATTGQAEAGQRETYRRIGESITAMLGSALLVRATVPSTFPLLLVAAGHADLFWQYRPTLPGVAAGALLVTEAGGLVTDLAGAPWRPGSDGILATAPALQAAALATLSTVD